VESILTAFPKILDQLEINPDAREAFVFAAWPRAVGEGLSEHTAPFEALVFVIDGEAEVEIAGRAYRVRTGETITLPATVPHAVKATTRFKMLLTMIRA